MVTPSQRSVSRIVRLFGSATSGQCPDVDDNGTWVDSLATTDATASGAVFQGAVSVFKTGLVSKAPVSAP